MDGSSPLLSFLVSTWVKAIRYNKSEGTAPEKNAANLLQLRHFFFITQDTLSVHCTQETNTKLGLCRPFRSNTTNLHGLHYLSHRRSS